MKDNIVTLTDANGKEVEFEFLDLIPYQDHEYVVLFPVDGEEADGVIILRLEAGDNEDEEAYAGVEDEDVLNRVFELFKENCRRELESGE